jgi:pimeloyl-ACP methyl ester carboxylesterase
MKRHSFVAATIVLLSLVCGNRSRVQSNAQHSSTDTRSARLAIISEPVFIETPSARLYGTLERPQSPSRVPVVLLITGSGPTDRGGNSPMFTGPNNSIKMLAESLAAQGIASVRYDKRGIAESGKGMQLAAEKAQMKLREDDLKFDAYIDDAVLWDKKLRGDDRFSSLTVIGHSEGSLIGMVAAQRLGADAFISLAGSGRPAQQILLEQLKAQLPADLLKMTEEILDRLAAGQTFGSVPPALNFLFRPSIQPYMISWFRYNPAKEIARLSVPVMIVQGTTDVQVSLEDAKVLAAAHPSAKLLFVDGMNHVLKMVPSQRDKQVSSYSDPSLPVAPSLISEIGGFVSNLRSQRRFCVRRLKTPRAGWDSAKRCPGASLLRRASASSGGYTAPPSGGRSANNPQGPCAYFAGTERFSREVPFLAM